MKAAGRTAGSGRSLVRPAGRILVALGLLLLAFAAFRTWGTGLLEWQAQRSLEPYLAAALEAPQPLSPPAQTQRPAGGRGAHPPTGSEWRAPQEGDVIGRIEIPAIGLSKVVLHGVRRETLRHGPGHYPGTPLPGQAGNAAIAGHRTTYGAPFHDLDRLKPGDPITVVTSEGTFDYVIEGHTSASGEQVGYVVVEPDALDVVADRGDNRLTLTACHPKHSARQRIVVTALLVDPPAGSWPAPTSTRASPTATGDPARQAPLARPPIAPGGNSEASASGWTPAGDALESSYGWQRDQLPPLVLWVAVTLIIGCAGKALGQRSRSRLVNALTALVLAPALFQCFTHLDRLLPAY